MGAPRLCSMKLSRNSRPSAGMVAIFPSSLTHLELSSSRNLQLSSLTILQHLIINGCGDGPWHWGCSPCLMPVSLTRLVASLDLRRDSDSALKLTRLTNLQHLVLGSVGNTDAHSEAHFLPHLPSLLLFDGGALKLSSAAMWMPKAHVEGLVWGAELPISHHTGLVTLHIADAGENLQDVFHHFRGRRHLTVDTFSIPQSAHNLLFVSVYQAMSSITLRHKSTVLLPPGHLCGCCYQLHRYQRELVIFKSLHPKPTLVAPPDTVLWHSPDTLFDELHEIETQK